MSQLSRDLALIRVDRQALAPAFADFAQSELAAAIASGAAKRVVARYVNGRRGADESSVVVPGAIEYEFSIWPAIIEFTLQALRDRSPVASGRYRDSWFVQVRGARARSFDDIAPDATVVFCNDRPYSRKIEFGHMQMSVPPGVIEDVHGMVVDRYGDTITARQANIPLRSGYILVGGRRSATRRRLQRGRRPGEPMAYPALILNLRGAA